MGIKKKILKFMNLFRTPKVITIPSIVRSEKILEDKTAFITGGSGGIGMAIAKKMLSAGANVIISGTNENKLQTCVQNIGFPKDKLKYIVLNMNDVSSFKDKIYEANEMFHTPISILVNSAGIIAKHSFFEITEDEFDDVFNVNVKGPFFICQIIADLFINNHIEGKILNLSSSSALRPAWGPYQMSKWAIRGFTTGLADLLIPYHIVVNAIAPGPTATAMLGKEDSEDISLVTSPIERFITPEEIAELALVLVSDLGNIVVGDTLYATGGSGVITLHK